MELDIGRRDAFTEKKAYFSPWKVTWRFPWRKRRGASNTEWELRVANYLSNFLKHQRHIFDIYETTICCVSLCSSERVICLQYIWTIN